MIVVKAKGEPLAESALKVFPNPSTGLFEVSLDKTVNQRSGEIIIYDNMSRPVKVISWNGNNITLDLSSYGKGMYFLQVVSPGWREVKKIVVQ